MNSDAAVWEEVRQGFLLSFARDRFAPSGMREHSAASVLGGRRVESSSRSGMSRTFMAAADGLGLRRKASAELIDTPFE
jgi:hypothetical protein